MAKHGITWIRPPSTLITAIKKNQTKYLAAVFALAMNQGGIMLGEARANKPWQDRTGNAKTGLFFAVEGFGRAMQKKGGRSRNTSTGKFQKVESAGMAVGNNELVIVLGHTMFYGVYLELAMAEQYAVVWPTIQNNAPKFMQALKVLTA